MSPYALERILRILDDQPADDPVRLAIERIVVRARLERADTDPVLQDLRKRVRAGHR